MALSRCGIRLHILAAARPRKGRGSEKIETAASGGAAERPVKDRGAKCWKDARDRVGRGYKVIIRAAAAAFHS